MHFPYLYNYKHSGNKAIIKFTNNNTLNVLTIIIITVI